MRKNQAYNKYGERSNHTTSRLFQGKTLASKKLYRVPEEGMVKGVCAGLAHYFDVPVRLIRVITVLSMFFGLFLLTLLAYIVLTLILDSAPEHYYQDEHQSTPHQLLDQLEYDLRFGEQQLRKVERYVTSDTFGVQNRFRQL